jgi:ribosome biogenesis GTPase
MNLETLGWTPAWAQRIDSLGEPQTRLRPGRVASVHGAACRLLNEEGEWTGVVSGRLRDHAAEVADLPTVGDWVAFEATDFRQAVIHAVLTRQSVLTRRVAGRTGATQALAANVDVILLVMGLDGDFNVRRLERALVMVAHSGAAPVIVLNKQDVAADLPAQRASVAAAAPDVPVAALSARDGRGLDTLDPYLRRGTTLALIGSSGVGKSTLVNGLLGQERLATGAVRAHDQRGRHTTTSRQLVPLPSGALLIDTPGLREIQLAADEDALDSAFADVAAAAVACRYRDCRHDGEPGCAVHDAVARGDISAERLASLKKLQKEVEYQARRGDPERERAVKSKWKAIHKAARHRGRRGGD